jgi:hypothetical protein
MTQTFLHGGCRGDIIYSLPAVIALGGGHYVLDGWHDMHPILDQQPYIRGVSQYTRQHIDYDFRPYAHDWQVKRRHLAQTHWSVLGGVKPLDLSQPWLDVPPVPTTEIVVQVSPRWPGVMSLEILHDYRDRAAFIGLPEEYDALNIPMECIPPSDIMTFAGRIRAAKLFVGNQSFGFSLAEAMKIPRIVTPNHEWRNCKPQSANGHATISHELIDHYLSGISTNSTGSSVK